MSVNEIEVILRRLDEQAKHMEKQDEQLLQIREHLAGLRAQAALGKWLAGTFIALGGIGATLLGIATR